MNSQRSDSNPGLFKEYIRTILPKVLKKSLYMATHFSPAESLAY